MPEEQEGTARAEAIARRDGTGAKRQWYLSPVRRILKRLSYVSASFDMAALTFLLLWSWRKDALLAFVAGLREEAD